MQVKSNQMGLMMQVKTLAKIENVTQQTAATSEESASASEELAAQAVQLKDFIKTI